MGNFKQQAFKCPEIVVRCMLLLLLEVEVVVVVVVVVEER